MSDAPEGSDSRGGRGVGAGPSSSTRARPDPAQGGVGKVLEVVWIVLALLIAIPSGLLLAFAPSGSKGLGHAVVGAIGLYGALGLFLLRSLVWLPTKIYRLFRPLPEGAPRRRWVDVVIVLGWALGIAATLWP